MALIGLFFFTCRLKALPLVARESDKVLSSWPLAAREKRVTRPCRAWETGLLGQLAGQASYRAARDQRTGM